MGERALHAAGRQCSAILHCCHLLSGSVMKTSFFHHVNRCAAGLLLLSSLLAAGNAVADINITVRNGVMTKAEGDSSPNQYHPNWGTNIGEFNFGITPIPEQLLVLWYENGGDYTGVRVSLKLLDGWKTVQLQSATGNSATAEIRLRAVSVLYDMINNEA